MNAAGLLKVGTEWSIATSQDGRIGKFRVTHAVDGGYVRGTIDFAEAGAQVSSAEQAIRRLAEAAEDLALAVMTVEEERLEHLSLSLTDPSAGSTLVLGRDFQALFVDPEVARMAFRIM